MWNLDNKGLDKKSQIKAHEDIIEEVAWHPKNENILASTSTDITMKIWDVRVTKKEFTLEKTKRCSIGLKWNSSGNTIAIITEENIISFFDFRKRDFIKHMKFK